MMTGERSSSAAEMQARTISCVKVSKNPTPYECACASASISFIVNSGISAPLYGITASDARGCEGTRTSRRFNTKYEQISSV